MAVATVEDSFSVEGLEGTESEDLEGARDGRVCGVKVSGEGERLDVLYAGGASGVCVC
jgi:hypothetical protein